MDYRRFIERLTKCAESLEDNPAFHPLVEIERTFTASEFTDLEASMVIAGLENVNIWNEFREFHGVANGFLFQWLYQGTQSVSTRSGSAQIAMVQEIYLPEYLPSSKRKQFYEQWHVVDRISPDDQVAVRFRNDSENPELYYFSDITGDYHRLNIEFPGYLNMLFEARAMYRWQQFFVEDDSFPVTKEDAEAFRHSLKTMFPDADVSYFKAKDER